MYRKKVFCFCVLFPTFAIMDCSIDKDIMSGGSVGLQPTNAAIKPLKTLVLALLIKYYNPQGFYNCDKESLKDYYHRLGFKANCNLKTFAACYNRLVDAGCFVSQSSNRSTVQLLGRNDIADLLGIKVDVSRLNQILRGCELHTLRLNDAVRLVAKKLMLANFTAQQHKINKKSEMINVANKLVKDQNNRLQGNNPKVIKKLLKEAAKAKKDVAQFAKEFTEANNTQIITGTIHLADKLGISQSLANKLLNEMVSSGIITRQIVKMILSKAAIGHLPNSYLSKYLNMAILTIGSIITICNI